MFEMIFALDIVEGNFVAFIGISAFLFIMFLSSVTVILYWVFAEGEPYDKSFGWFFLSLTLIFVISILYYGW